MKLRLPLVEKLKRFFGQSQPFKRYDFSQGDLVKIGRIMDNGGAVGQIHSGNRFPIICVLQAMIYLCPGN